MKEQKNLPHYLRIISEEDFDWKFKDFMIRRTHFFAYFYGITDTIGKSWSKETVIAEPIVEEAEHILEYQDKILFVRFPVKENTFKEKNNIYRTNYHTRIEIIPTLIYYKDACEVSRLTGEELFEEDKVKDLISSSVSM